MSKILEIEKRSFPDPYDYFILSQLLLAGPGDFLVADCEGSILGYITGVSRENEGMIYSIAVLEEHRRKGIGRALLRAELDVLSRECAHVHLQVSVKNEAAISLYREFGFVESGRIKRYYSNGDDAWVMRLDLSRSRRP